MSQLQPLSGVHLRHTGCESKEICPYHVRLKVKPLARLHFKGLGFSVTKLETPNAFLAWSFTSLLASRAVLLLWGLLATTKLCLGLDCFVLTYACFFDLEKTSFEPDMGICFCNPTLGSRGRKTMCSKETWVRRPCVKTNIQTTKTGKGVHLRYWYVEDIPQSAKQEPSYLMNFEQRIYFLIRH